MRKWFNKNKILLMAFGLISIILFTLVYITISYILQPDVLVQLKKYAETGEITESLVKYSILAFISLIFSVIWTILFTVLLWKIIFPTRKSVESAFMIDNYKYLYNLPNEIKKGLKKYEQ